MTISQQKGPYTNDVESMRKPRRQIFRVFNPFPPRLCSVYYDERLLLQIFEFNQFMLYVPK